MRVITNMYSCVPFSKLVGPFQDAAGARRRCQGDVAATAEVLLLRPERRCERPCTAESALCTGQNGGLLCGTIFILRGTRTLMRARYDFYNMPLSHVLSPLANRLKMQGTFHLKHRFSTGEEHNVRVS